MKVGDLVRRKNSDGNVGIIVAPSRPPTSESSNSDDPWVWPVAWFQSGGRIKPASEDMLEVISERLRWTGW